MKTLLLLALFALQTTDFQRDSKSAVWKFPDGSLAVVVASGQSPRPLVTKACGGPCSPEWVGEVWYQGDTVPDLNAAPKRTIRPSGIGIWDFGGDNLLVIVPTGPTGDRLLDDVCRNCALRYMGQLWYADTLR